AGSARPPSRSRTPKACRPMPSPWSCACRARYRLRLLERRNEHPRPLQGPLGRSPRRRPGALPAPDGRHPPRAPARRVSPAPPRPRDRGRAICRCRSRFLRRHRERGDRTAGRDRRAAGRPPGRRLDAGPARQDDAANPPRRDLRADRPRGRPDRHRDRRVPRRHPRLLRPARGEIRQRRARCSGEGGALSGEAAFIESLRALAHHPAARGLADDAAVLEDGGEAIVLTHDMLVEGVHFLPGADWADVAWKLVATNLSDLAAKGAEPLGVLLGFMLGGQIERFIDGLSDVLEHYGVPLLGGDTVTGGPPRSFGLTAIGRATHRPVPSRAGAKPGDVLWLTGQVGAAMLGFEALRD